MVSFGGTRHRVWRETTVAANRYTLWSFAAFVEQHPTTPKPWHRATPDDLTRYLARPCQRGKRAGKPPSAGHRASAGGKVITFYQWACERGHGPDAKAWLRVRAERYPQPGERAVPLADIATLLRSTAADKRTQLCVALGYHCLLRSGEIARLKVEDVRLRDPGNPMLYVDGKGGVEGWVPVPPPLRPLLAAYLATRPPSGPLIENRRWPAQHVTPSRVGAMVGIARRAVGI